MFFESRAEKEFKGFVLNFIEQINEMLVESQFGSKFTFNGLILYFDDTAPPEISEENRGAITRLLDLKTKNPDLLHYLESDDFDGAIKLTKGMLAEKIKFLSTNDFQSDSVLYYSASTVYITDLLILLMIEIECILFKRENTRLTDKVNSLFEGSVMVFKNVVNEMTLEKLPSDFRSLTPRSELLYKKLS